MKSQPASSTVVFYDGHCPFCLGWVRFLLRRDPHDRLRFAPLTGNWAAEFFQSHPRPDTDSLLLWQGNRLHSESEAVWRLAALLPFPWSMARFLHFLPRLFRDAAYRWIARHRYRWFGRHPQCRLPTKGESRKILE